MTGTLAVNRRDCNDNGVHPLKVICSRSDSKENSLKKKERVQTSAACGARDNHNRGA